MKKTIIALFSIVFLAFSCKDPNQAEWKEFPSGGGNTEQGGNSGAYDYSAGIMIMSSNVRYYQGTVNGQDTGSRAWEKRRVGYYTMVNTVKPLLIGTQEAEMNQIDDILANCPGYASVGVGRTDGNRKGESTSILYRTAEIAIDKWGTIWLSPTPSVPNSRFPEDDTPRTATWAVVTVKKTGNKFFFLNTHTSLVEASQKKEIDLILKTVDEKCPDGIPAVMSADWNLEENDPVLAPIFKTFVSARRTAEETNDQFTFSAWGSAEKQLDHIFLRDMGKCYKFARVASTWSSYIISDHYPVYTIVDFPTKN